MRILWIEDSENISVENYFESKVFNDHEIDPIIEHSKDGFLFDSAYKFIDEQLERYDYIIIDIDLKNSDIKKDGKAEEIMNLLESNSKEEFLEAQNSSNGCVQWASDGKAIPPPSNTSVV